MHSKRKIPDSWRTGWKAKVCTSFFSVFEGIQEPFILSLACKSFVLNHVYIHSFRSIIKATETFPGGGGIWSPGMDLWWGIWTAFRPREGGIWTKILIKIQMPGGCPGGGMLKLRFDWYINTHPLVGSLENSDRKVKQFRVIPRIALSRLVYCSSIHWPNWMCLVLQRDSRFVSRNCHATHKALT